MLPSSPSADLSQYVLLRLCFGRAVFLLPLSQRTGEHDCASPAVAPQGASRRRSKSLLKHRVQGCALPAMLPSFPSADFFQYASLRLCFGRAVFCCPFPGELGSTAENVILKGKSAAKRCNPPFFARQTVLYYNCIGACRKGSKPVRFTQGSVSRARCTEKAVF